MLVLRTIDVAVHSYTLRARTSAWLSSDSTGALPAIRDQSLLSGVLSVLPRCSTFAFFKPVKNLRGSDELAPLFRMRPALARTDASICLRFADPDAMLAAPGWHLSAAVGNQQIDAVGARLLLQFDLRLYTNTYTYKSRFKFKLLTLNSDQSNRSGESVIN